MFEAVHREPGATLFWHLDDRYLRATKTFRQQALDVAPGVHVLTVVDETGNNFRAASKCSASRAERGFAAAGPLWLVAAIVAL